MNIFHFPSNQILDVKKTFAELLKDIYSKNECEVLFQRITEHFGYDSFQTNIHFNQSELIDLTEIIKELQNKKPLAYILGYSYFFNMKFFVNENVLIPRPETEELVLQVKQIIETNYKNQSLNILDIGTGSGCIAIALKKIFPYANITAIDKSSDALEIAQKNAAFYQLSINFKKLDMLNESLNETYDIIVSNPPYIPESDKNTIDESVIKFEPSMALISNTAIEFYERIFYLSKNILAPKGFVFMELNQYYGKEILDLSKKFEYFQKTELLKDWSGNDRFIVCYKIYTKTN
jgi:release factor glutamine methyltransferase